MQSYRLAKHFTMYSTSSTWVAPGYSVGLFTGLKAKTQLGVASWTGTEDSDRYSWINWASTFLTPRRCSGHHEHWACALLCK